MSIPNSDAFLIIPKAFSHVKRFLHHLEKWIPILYRLCSVKKLAKLMGFFALWILNLFSPTAMWILFPKLWNYILFFTFFRCVCWSKNRGDSATKNEEKVCVCHHCGPENLKKSRTKKRVKSNKSISQKFFLTKFHFLQFQKWP